MRTYSITTRLGLTAQVRQYGETGTPVLYFHGLSGLFTEEPFLEALAAAEHVVHAPNWPGYGDEPGEERLTDMQDFALHGWDLADAIAAETGFVEKPHLMGLDLGAMIAAEMACIEIGRAHV